MRKPTATQIVASLLEYGIPGGDEPRAGSPDDPWRAKQGFKPIKFRRGDFEGQRGTVPKPEAVPVPIKKKTPLPPHTGGAQSARFNWTPPTSESRLHELGGYYCFTCKQPTTTKMDEKTRKFNCARCGAEINYAKHGNKPVPKEAPAPKAE